MRKTLTLAIVLLSLCSCSGRTTSTAAVAPPVAGATVVAAPSPTATAPTVDGVPAASIPDELCVFVDREKLKLGSTVSSSAARKRVRTDFRTWTTQDQDRAVPSKKDLDAITTATCPQVRTRLLHAAHATSLAHLMS